MFREEEEEEEEKIHLENSLVLTRRKTSKAMVHVRLTKDLRLHLQDPVIRPTMPRSRRSYAKEIPNPWMQVIQKTLKAGRLHGGWVILTMRAAVEV